jgi:hypothetical protein
MPAPADDDATTRIIAEIHRIDVLSMAESVIVTDVSGRTYGAPPLCSLSEIAFLLQAIEDAAAERDLSEETVAAVSVLCERGGKSDYATLRGHDRRVAALRRVAATLGEKFE